MTRSPPLDLVNHISFSRIFLCFQNNRHLVLNILTFHVLSVPFTFHFHLVSQHAGVIPLHHTSIAEENIGLELPDHMKSRAFKLIVEIPLQPLEEEGDCTTTTSSGKKTKVSILCFVHPFTIIKFQIFTPM